MKNVLLMYNPNSGDKSFRYQLDDFIEAFGKKGYLVKVVRSQHKGHMKEYLENGSLRECHGVFVAGGDGSVNEVINGMMEHNIDIPLGIIPAGTANDFANSLKMPGSFKQCIDVLTDMKVEYVDVGIANEQYFINVCCGGLFTNVSQNIDIDLKNTLGKLAYYIKGAEQIYNVKPVHLNLDIDGEKFAEEFYIFLILNSSGAGGFYNIVPTAELNDGYFDFFAVRSNISIMDFPRILMKLMRGEHLNDKIVLHRRCKHIHIESENFEEVFEETDIDGERGPDIPIQVKIKPKALRVFANKETKSID